MKVRCKQENGTVFLTLGRVYEVVNASVAHDSCYTIFDDSGAQAQYNKTRFEIVDDIGAHVGERMSGPVIAPPPPPSQKPNWEALVASIEGFQGWAEPEPTDPMEVRYAVIRVGTYNFCKWVRVSPVPGVPRVRSTKCWGGSRSTFVAQDDALQNKKEMLRRYGIR